MELFDTHCHIQSIGQTRGERTTLKLWERAGDTSLDAVLTAARDNDVTQMVCVGCDLEDSRLAVECVQRSDALFASIGIHPHEAQHHLTDTVKADFANLLEDGPLDRKIVAIGECGLDYFYEHSPKDAQVEILKFQIELALKYDLALIFHVREAFDDFWPIFESYPTENLRGVLHSFTDSVENMQRATAHGLYIGVNGIATFAKEEDKRVMYRTIPLDRLLLETDAPFLTPHPYRGSINEPKHIRTIAEFLETIRGESLNQLAEATTQNARTLFRV